MTDRLEATLARLKESQRRRAALEQSVGTSSGRAVSSSVEEASARADAVKKRLQEARQRREALAAGAGNARASSATASSEATSETLRADAAPAPTDDAASVPSSPPSLSDAEARKQRLLDLKAKVASLDDSDDDSDGEAGSNQQGPSSVAAASAAVAESVTHVPKEDESTVKVREAKRRNARFEEDSAGRAKVAKLLAANKGGGPQAVQEMLDVNWREHYERVDAWEQNKEAIMAWLGDRDVAQALFAHIVAPSTSDLACARATCLYQRALVSLSPPGDSLVTDFLSTDSSSGKSTLLETLLLRPFESSLPLGQAKAEALCTICTCILHKDPPAVCKALGSDDSVAVGRHWTSNVASHLGDSDAVGLFLCAFLQETAQLSKTETGEAGTALLHNPVGVSVQSLWVDGGFIPTLWSVLQEGGSSSACDGAKRAADVLMAVAAATAPPVRRKSDAQISSSEGTVVSQSLEDILFSEQAGAACVANPSAGMQLLHILLSPAVHMEPDGEMFTVHRPASAKLAATVVSRHLQGLHDAVRSGSKFTPFIAEDEAKRQGQGAFMHPMLGTTRLAAVEVVLQLAMVNDGEHLPALCSCGIVISCVELFFAYPNHHFLHHAVVSLVEAVLCGGSGGGASETTSNSVARAAFIADSRLVESILDAHQSNTVRMHYDKDLCDGFRTDAMAHLPGLTAKLTAATENCADVAALMEKHSPHWDAFIKSEIDGQRKLQQGGTKPPPPSGAPLSFLMSNDEIKEKEERQRNIAATLERIRNRSNAPADSNATSNNDASEI